MKSIFSWGLSTSQRQAKYRLIEKPNKDNPFFLIGDLFHYLMWTKNLYRKHLIGPGHTVCVDGSSTYDLEQ